MCTDTGRSNQQEVIVSEVRCESRKKQVMFKLAYDCQSVMKADSVKYCGYRDKCVL